MIGTFKRATAVLAALAVSWVSSESPAANAVTLIHSNDVMGDIEPCGCRTNPQGGMARKANYIAKLPKAEADALIQVDSGDLLFSTDLLPELLHNQAELQATYLLRSLDQLKHDVVVPGEKDFALGVKIFDRLRKKSKARFLAANLTRKNGKAFLDKSVLITKKNAEGQPIKVGIIGLVGEHLTWPKELKASPAIAAAKREVKALRKKADLIVLVTHQGLDLDKALAAAVPGIDIIVGGHTQSFLQEPVRVGKTTIYQSSFRNQYIGVLPLGKPFAGTGYQLVGLDPGYDSPPDALNAMDDLVREFKTAIATLNSQEETKLHAQNAVSQATGEKFHTFAKCAECHLKQFDFWRKTSHALALQPLLEKDQFKNKECLGCHTVGLGDPQGFKNVNKLAEYKKVPPPLPKPEPREPQEGDIVPDPADEYAAQFNAEGTIEPMPTNELARYLKEMHDASSLKNEIKIIQSDPQSMTLRRSLGLIHRSWTPVQCENCHQPGRDHPFSGTYSKKVETSACLKCHTAERAPNWYSGGKLDQEKVTAKRALIACPAGEATDMD